MNHVRKKETPDLWHSRIGHPSYQSLNYLSFISIESNKHIDCSVCFQAKQTKASFPSISNNSVEPFELIHCDLWGPYRTPSTCGAFYFLAILDDCTRAVWIFLLTEKSEVKTKYPQFFSMIQTQFNK